MYSRAEHAHASRLWRCDDQRTDSGLTCQLLGIRTAAELERSPFLGAVFEGAVAGEISKAQINRGLPCELYYPRDQQGLEVDFLVPMPGGAYQLIEAKATRSPHSDMAKPMLSLARTWRAAVATRELAGCMLVHREARAAVKSSALAPVVKALTFGQLVEVLNAVSVKSRSS